MDIFCTMVRAPIDIRQNAWAGYNPKPIRNWKPVITPNFFSLLININGYTAIIRYIYFMEPQYKTLETIFNITKEDPQPTTYKCRPREIILRQFQDWSVINQHLQLLEAEGLIITRQEETMVIMITISGMEKIKDDGVLQAGNQLH